MSVPSALHSSASDLWITPEPCFGPLHARFHFVLDACAADAEAARVPRFYSPEQDGLVQPWWTDGMSACAHPSPAVWCNPPFSQAGKWIRKAYDEVRLNRVTAVLFLTAATDTVAWHDLVFKHAVEIVFMGRVACLAGEDIVNPATGKVTVRKGELGKAPPKGNAIVVFDPYWQGPPRIRTWRVGRTA